MDIDARTLACWNDNAWDDATAAANSFRPQLRLMERNASSLFQSGSLGSVSKNSASQSYAGSGFGRFSVVQIQQAFRMLIELYDECLKEANCIVNALGLNPVNPCLQWFVPYINGNPAANPPIPPFAQDPDNAVYAMISYRLGTPVEEYQIDLSYLRLRPTLGSPIPATW